MIIHWTPAYGPALTAACGQSIGGNEHTGHFASSFTSGAVLSGHQLCPACAHLLEMP